MFKVRVIPASTSGRRVVRASTSSTCAMPAIRWRRRSPMTAGADERASSTSPRRMNRGTMLDGARRTAEALLHAGDGRRRRACHRRHPHLCAPAPKVLDQQRGGECAIRQEAASSATSASWWRSTPSGWRGRALRPLEIFTMAAAGDRHRRRRICREVVALGAGGVLLTSMDATAPGGFDIHDPGHRRASAYL